MRKNVTVCEFSAISVLDKEKSLCYARKGHKKSDHLNHHKSILNEHRIHTDSIQIKKRDKKQIYIYKDI